MDTVFPPHSRSELRNNYLNKSSTFNKIVIDTKFQYPTLRGASIVPNTQLLKAVTLV